MLGEPSSITFAKSGYSFLGQDARGNPTFCRIGSPCGPTARMEQGISHMSYDPNTPISRPIPDDLLPKLQKESEFLLESTPFELAQAIFNESPYKEFSHVS